VVTRLVALIPGLFSVDDMPLLGVLIVVVLILALAFFFYLMNIQEKIGVNKG
jgi:Tfp pilus assembly protein PilO